MLMWPKLPSNMLLDFLINKTSHLLHLRNSKQNYITQLNFWHHSQGKWTYKRNIYFKLIALIQADSTLEEAHINTQAETRLITFVTGSWPLVAAAILTFGQRIPSSNKAAVLQRCFKWTVPTSGTEGRGLAGLAVMPRPLAHVYIVGMDWNPASCPLLQPFSLSHWHPLSPSVQ